MSDGPIAFRTLRLLSSAKTVARDALRTTAVRSRTSRRAPSARRSDPPRWYRVALPM